MQGSKAKRARASETSKEADNSRDMKGRQGWSQESRAEGSI